MSFWIFLLFSCSILIPPLQGQFLELHPESPPSSRGDRAPTHPQGVPNTVPSSHRRRQAPLSVSGPFIAPERSLNLSNWRQLALILRFKRLPKRIFSVKVASLKFLCEKKAQHSRESRKRKVPGLPPHKTSLPRAGIEDFWVHYSRSNNFVSDSDAFPAKKAAKPAQTKSQNSQTHYKTKKTSSALLWKPREARCARTGRRNLTLFD